ncbi:hypothetical protein OG738_44255 [Amycolatopsis sp. NBC_01488]
MLRASFSFTPSASGCPKGVSAFFGARVPSRPSQVSFFQPELPNHDGTVRGRFRPSSGSPLSQCSGPRAHLPSSCSSRPTPSGGNSSASASENSSTTWRAAWTLCSPSCRAAWMNAPTEPEFTARACAVNCWAYWSNCAMTESTADFADWTSWDAVESRFAWSSSFVAASVSSSPSFRAAVANAV